MFNAPKSNVPEYKVVFPWYPDDLVALLLSVLTSNYFQSKNRVYKTQSFICARGLQALTAFLLPGQNIRNSRM